MASSTKAAKGNYSSPKVTTILEEQGSGDNASASEQESGNLITLSDTGKESGQMVDKEFAKQPKNRDLVPPIHLADLSLSLPATPTTAINRLKPDVQDRQEKIEQALLDLEDLGVTFGQVVREQEPLQDLNLSDLARKYRTPSNRLSTILRQDPHLFGNSYETSYDTQDQSNMEVTHDSSMNQEEQGHDDTSSSSSTSDEASTSTNSSSSTSYGDSCNISLPPVPDGATGAAATDYWLALRDTAKKLKKERKKASKRKKKSKSSADVLFLYLMKAVNDYQLPVLNYDPSPSRRRGKFNHFLEKLKLVISAVRQTKNVLSNPAKPRPPKRKAANQALYRVLCSKTEQHVPHAVKPANRTTGSRRWIPSRAIATEVVRRSRRSRLPTTCYQRIQHRASQGRRNDVLLQQKVRLSLPQRSSLWRQDD